MDLGRCIGADMDKIEDRPFMQWMLTEGVVKVSLKELDKKNKVVCVSGLGNKMLYLLAKIIPDRLWHAPAPAMAANMP